MKIKIMIITLIMLAVSLMTENIQFVEEAQSTPPGVGNTDFCFHNGVGYAIVEKTQVCPPFVAATELHSGDNAIIKKLENGYWITKTIDQVHCQVTKGPADNVNPNL